MIENARKYGKTVKIKMRLYNKCWGNQVEPTKKN